VKLLTSFTVFGSIRREIREIMADIGDGAAAQTQFGENCCVGVHCCSVVFLTCYRLRDDLQWFSLNCYSYIVLLILSDSTEKFGLLSSTQQRTTDAGV